MGSGVMHIHTADNSKILQSMMVQRRYLSSNYLRIVLLSQTLSFSLTIVTLNQTKRMATRWAGLKWRSGGIYNSGQDLSNASAM